MALVSDVEVEDGLIRDLQVTFRLKQFRNEEAFVRRPFVTLGKVPLQFLQQVREPRCYKGQRHIPGWEWVSGTQTLVWYESRMEMFAIRHMEFLHDVAFVVAQPFTLHFTLSGKQYTHVPDLLFVLADQTKHLINVKPLKYMKQARALRAFAASEELCRQLRWNYSTMHEAQPVVTANVRWLNGYRRLPHLYDVYSERIEFAAKSFCTIAQALEGIDHPVLARPTLFHMMWSGKLTFDINQILSDDTLIQLQRKDHRGAS